MARSKEARALFGLSTARSVCPSTVQPWASTPAATYYQWLANGVPIIQATNSTFNILNYPIGTVFTCWVSTLDTNGTGSVRAVTSNSCTVT